VWTATYRPGLGWTAPLRLQRTSGVESIELEVEAGGDVHAAWIAHDGDGGRAFSARRDHAGGWSAIERLDADGAWQVSLALEPDGDAVAVWVEHDYPEYDVKARRYRPGAGWGAISRATPGPTHGFIIGATIDAYGTATAVWWDPYALALRGAQWHELAGWTEPVTIHHTGDTQAWARLLVDGAGGVTALWQDHCLHTATLTAGTWSVPECIGDAHGAFAFDQDRHGRVQVVWAGARPAGHAMQSVRLDGVWSDQLQLATGPEGSWTQDVGLDGAGRALAVWGQRHAGVCDFDGCAPGTGEVRASIFTPGVGWSADELVDTRPGLPTFFSVAVAPSGAAQLLWTHLLPDGGLDMNFGLFTASYE
jgi:hypothetical protein